jgi:DNA-binding HxlR family transcriptional regulator
MALLDLLGQRWVLRILWELRQDALTFRALQLACGRLSPSVLNDRLHDLREAGFVEMAEDSGYGLSPMGKELLRRLMPLTALAEEWARHVARRSP